MSLFRRADDAILRSRDLRQELSAALDVAQLQQDFWMRLMELSELVDVATYAEIRSRPSASSSPVSDRLSRN
jgi:hypothetical protein